MNKKKKEKRRTIRRECFVPVESKEGTIFENSQTVDISPSGIGFITPQNVTLQKRIPVAIAFNPESDPIIVIGQVKWVRYIPAENYYRVGINFKDVLMGSKSDLKQFS